MTDQDELAAHLRAAVEAVETARVPDDLREVAFRRALDVTFGGVPVAGETSSDTPPPAPNSSTPSGSQGSGSKPTSKIMAKLGIDQKTVDAVYEIDSDELHISLGPSKFNGQVTKAMEEIARLVVAGRQASGMDAEWTSFEEIRSACDALGRYSPSNFSTYVKKLDRDGFRLQGSGGNRELKANATGFEQTGALAKRLAGE